MQLLFCDTFTNVAATHNGGWAVIKFPCMVGIDEIWILPPHAKPHTSLIEPRFIGQTSPDNFHVDFYSDNKSASTTTFELVGAMEYSTLSHNRFQPTNPVFSERLFLNGWFTTVSVAIYGTVLSTSMDAKNIGRSLVIVQGKTEGRRVYEQVVPAPTIGRLEIDRQISDFRTNSSSYLPPTQEKPRHHHDDQSNKAYQDLQNVLMNYAADGARDVKHYHPTKSSLYDKNAVGEHHRLSGYESNRYEQQNITVPVDSPVKLLQHQFEKASDYEEVSEEDLGYDDSNLYPELEDDDDLIFPVSMMQFNPFLIELLPLEHYSPPDISKFEEDISKLINECPIESQDLEQEKTLESKKEKSGPKTPEIMLSLTDKVNIEIIDNKIVINYFDENSVVEFLTAIEEIFPILSKELPEMIINENEMLAHQLCGWMLIAIDGSENIKQMVGTNVRMLKAGLNLLLQLARTFPDIVNILTDNNLTDKLLELLSDRFIASSIKTLAIHCLDALLDWPYAIDTFLDNKNLSENGKSYNYTCLIELLLTSQPARVASALTRLIKKINFYQTLSNFQSTTNDVFKNQIPKINDDCMSSDNEAEDDCDDVIMEEEVIEEDIETDDKIVDVEINTENKLEPSDMEFQEEGSNDDQDNNKLPLESVLCVETVNLTMDTVNDLVSYLKTITEILSTNGETMTQMPVKAFPVKGQTNALDTDNTTRTIFRMFEHFNTLASAQILLTIPVVSSVNELFETLYTFLDLLMMSQPGLLHLAFNFKTTVCIFRHLLCSAEEFTKQEIESVGTSAHMGAKLALHLQCIQCLDQLNCLLSQDDSNEDDMVDILKMFYSLLYTPFGRHWVALFFNLKNNVKALITCLQLNKNDLAAENAKADIVKKDNVSKPETTKDDESVDKDSSTDNEHKPMKKCAIAGYAANILLTVVKLSRKVDCLKVHGKAIVNACRGLSTIPGTENILNWLADGEKMLSNKSIGDLVQYVKERSMLLEWSKLCVEGQSICTALRLLCHELKIDLNSTFDGVNYEAALNVLSLGGLPVFCNAVEKLHSCLAYPCHSQHSISYINNFDFYNLVTNMGFGFMRIIAHMVNLFAESDGNICAEYITKPILTLYVDLTTLFRSKDTDMLAQVTNIVTNVLTLLSSSSRKVIPVEKGKEQPQNIKIVIEQLFNFTEESCCNFVPGLTLISNILPLPLPIIVEEEEDVPESVDDTIIQSRAAMAENFKENFEKSSLFLTSLAHSTCLPLLEVLIPVCQQFIDLSDDLGSLLLMSLVKKMLVRNEAKRSDEKHESTYIIQSQVITVLSEICKLPSAKASLLSLSNFNEKMLPKIFEVIMKRNMHDLAGVKATLMLIIPLLDAEISMLMDNESVLSVDHHSDVGKLAIRAIQQHDLQTNSTALQVLILLSRYEKGFKCIKKHFNNSNLQSLMKFLLKQLQQTDDFMRIEVALENISQMVVFLLSLQDTFYSGVKNCRTHRMTFTEFKQLVCGVNFSCKLLFEIKDKVTELVGDDETYAFLTDEISSLCQTLLNKKQDDQEKQVSSNVQDVPVENLTLAELYKNRPVVVRGNEDYSDDIKRGILTGQEEMSFLHKNITRNKDCYNLLEMSEKYCPGFDLSKELKKLVEFADSAEIDRLKLLAKEKRKQKLETFSMRIGKSFNYTKRSHGLSNQLNIPRGRGRGRGRPFIHNYRPYDLFRQRKQNTSRPPSMHVDDFIAADQEDENKKLFKSPHSPMQSSSYRRSTSSRPYIKREFIPRGRGRSSTSFHPRINTSHSVQNFTGKPHYPKQLSSPTFAKFSERYPSTHNREFGSRITFSPREGFKTSKAQWGYNNPRGSYRPFRSRGMKSTRGITTRNYYNLNHNNRGRGGYVNNRGMKQHIRSFTR